MKRYKHGGLKLRANIQNTGMAFENCINIVNNFYFSKGLGLIQKQYTPFIPLRDKVGKVIDVKVADKAIADYAGVFGKYAVAFEAKSCSSDKFEFNRLKMHQLETLAECADIISEAINDLRIARKAAKNDPDPLASARAFHDVVIPIMDKLRAAADHAEQVCGEDFWPLPTYTQMLWYVKD